MSEGSIRPLLDPNFTITATVGIIVTERAIHGGTVPERGKGTQKAKIGSSTEGLREAMKHPGERKEAETVLGHGLQKEEGAGSRRGRFLRELTQRTRRSLSGHTFWGPFPR